MYSKPIDSIVKKSKIETLFIFEIDRLGGLVVSFVYFVHFPCHTFRKGRLLLAISIKEIRSRDFRLS